MEDVAAGEELGIILFPFRRLSLPKANQLLGISQPHPRVITAEWNQLAVGSNVLYDAATQPSQVITFAVHKVHPRDKHAV
jgi:hypothetical protein